MTLKKSKIVKVISNPRRYSYALGYGTKSRTAYKFLVEKGKVNTLEELTARFSVEVVNKQFYSEIATCFTELVGGDRNGCHYERQLDLTIYLSIWFRKIKEDLYRFFLLLL